MEKNKISKQLSYLLRHNPEDLKMDKNGYIEVESVLKKLDINQDELEFIVKNNDKNRFSFNNSMDKIRASQGHSIKGINVNLKHKIPPAVLYHGTSPKTLPLIKKGGLKKMNRLYVHLSLDKTVAYEVGLRYSKKDKPTILCIDCVKMVSDGYKFYQSDNGVWLIDTVPYKYITVNK